MKYIIEIKPEHEDSFKGVMILGAKDSNLFVDVLAVDDLEELDYDHINENLDRIQNEAYQRGLADGKAQSEDGCEGCRYESRASEEKPCVDCSKNFDNHWMEKQTDEIKVGDEVEVINSGNKYTIVWIVGTDLRGFACDGLTCYLRSNDVRKTGRHFDIDKILEEMKE